MRLATMDDIARALGITKSTVSKALSGADDVSAAMRRLVVEKAVELGYSRIVRSGSPRRLCIFVLHMRYRQPDDFGYDVVTGFRKLAEPAGYHVDVIELDDDMQHAISYDAFMLREDYPGALFLGLSLSDPWMACLQRCRTPAVLHDNLIHGNPCVACVGVNNEEAMLLAIAHLKSLGHRRIGYLSSELKSHVYLQRFHAFFSAMKKNRLPAPRTLTGSAYQTSECVQLHLPRLIDEGCTAVMCSHDHLANSAMIHTRSLGLRVPQDLSFVGFDDIPLCRSTSPPLTTVRQSRDELGRCAFSALHNLIQQTPISMLLLHAELVVRGSTAAPGARQPGQKKE